jgi:peptidoglycan glycosyltransferase
MGTDMNSPIRTARGRPIQGSSLPGDVWQDVMSDAHSGSPVEDFPPFRPIGQPPSPLAPNEEPPPASEPLPPSFEPPPGPAAGSPPDGPDVTPDDPERPGILGDPGVDHPTDDEDCSVTPCG